MKKKNGFSLVEVLVVILVIGIIAAIGIPTFITIRKNILKSQYENVKMRIENKAELYAQDTQILTVSVGKLIAEGYLEADDQTDIYNPTDNSSLNCNVVEINIVDGEYIATLTDNGNLLEDGTCSTYDVKVANLIKPECYSESGNADEIASCQKTYELTDGKWYSGSIKLTPVEVDGKNIISYRWSSLTGDSSTDNYVIVQTDSVKSTTYSLSLTYEDGSSVSDSLNINIDNQAPTILDIIKDDNWSNMAKNVSISATDGAGSGLYSYYVGNNENCANEEFSSENKFALEEGTYYACVKDYAGNVSSAEEFTIDKIDTNPPVAIKGSNGSYFETYSSTFGNTYYSELTRKIKFRDEESIMAYVKYCYTSGNTCTPDTDATIVQGQETDALLTYPANKDAQRVCVVGIDSVGNTSEVYCDDTFLVDTTAPVNVKAVHNSSKSSYVNVSASDSESDIYKYVCHYGTSSANLNQTVNAQNGSCNLGRLTSGKTYYVKVDAYNNANLVTSSGTTSFVANVTIDDAYEQICGTSSYCNNGYFINYAGYLFVVYRNSSGYKAIYYSNLSNNYFLQSGCCNNGHCTYSGSHYPNGVLSSYLNNTFLNNLTSYSSYIKRATWYTGEMGSITSRTTSAYVGLLDYNEYSATTSNTDMYVGASGVPFWLITPYGPNSTDYGYYQNVTITYSSGRFTVSKAVVNTSSGVRPVIVFKSGIVFTGGDGTRSNPYTIL